MYRFTEVDTDDEDVVELLTELHQTVFLDTAPMPEFDYGHWWVGTDGREAAAFCGIVQSTYHPTYAYLKRAGVLFNHTGNRLQQRMIRLRERKARSLGFSYIISDTTDNIRSANNLMACGYRLFRPEEGWSFDNALYWRKKL